MKKKNEKIPRKAAKTKAHKKKNTRRTKNASGDSKNKPAERPVRKQKPKQVKRPGSRVVKLSQKDYKALTAYENLNAPEDVKEFLRYLYLRRKKKGGKFKAPTLLDAKKYLKVVNNLNNPKLVLYWNLPVEITKEDVDTSYRIRNFNGRTEYSGYSKVKALQSVHSLNRYIDEVRKILKTNETGTFFGYVPVTFYKRDKLFKSKERPIFKVDINYRDIDVNDDVKSEILRLFNDE
jgi:hypothetical protein